MGLFHHHSEQTQQVDPRQAQDHTQYIPEKQPTQQEVNVAAQDPNHPANPEHPNHSGWAKAMGSRFGNAIIFGGGATIGSQIINGIGL